jgi:hypothetical protein
MAAAVAAVAAQLGSRVSAAQAAAIQQVFVAVVRGIAAEATSRQAPPAVAAAVAEAGTAAAAAAGSQVVGEEEPQQQQQQQERGESAGLPPALTTDAVAALQLQMLYGWLRLWCKRGNQEQMAAVLKTMAGLCQQPATAAAAGAAAAQHD